MANFFATASDSSAGSHIPDNMQADEPVEMLIHEEAEKYEAESETNILYVQSTKIQMNHEEAEIDMPSYAEYSDGLDRHLLSPTLTHIDSKVQYVKVVHKALLKQFNSYGIVLTLLVSITFVAFLQPPGSVDQDGNVRSSYLIASFICFITFSFMLACTGLLTVIVGLGTLLQPNYISGFDSSMQRPPRGNSKLREESKNARLVYDHLPKLSKVVLSNLLRIRRLEIYMGLSLIMCVMAFICSGLAITGSSNLNRYTLAVSIGVSSLILFFEIAKIFLGLSLREKKILLENSLGPEIRFPTCGLETVSHRLGRYSNAFGSFFIP